MYRTLDDLDVKGKRVLVRADLNVPMRNGQVTDTTRIERQAPTIRELAEKGARVIVLSHFERPGGKIVLIETQGTGFEPPHPPQHLLEYYEFLKEQGFESTWFRSDYEFDSAVEARELTEFFFGQELADQFSGRILPECTGIWWK